MAGDTVSARDEGPVLVRRDGSVVTLVLNNPPMNPVGIEQVEALEELTRAIELDDGVRAVILTGSGGNFCAGANIKQFGRVGAEESEEDYMVRRQQMVTALERLPKPVIAMVRGNALGGGFELALACHFRFADPTARFGLPEIKLGIIPAWGGTQRLSRLVARDVALRVMLTAEFLPAEEAHRLGIVTELVAAEELEQRTAEFAARLAAGPRVATASVLDAVVRGSRLSFEDGLRVEVEGALAARRSADYREGVQAFLEKRPPRFS